MPLDEDLGKARGNNRFTVWRHVTPLHHKLVDTMLRLPMHLIVTLRTKVAYVIEEDARGKHVPRKVGMAPIQREGCEYEFDVIGELHSTVLTISKTRLRFLQGLVLESDPRDCGSRKPESVELFEIYRGYELLAELKHAG